MLGCSDEALFKRCQAEGACILTTDRDFFHTVPYRHPGHNGIVVIALKQPKREAILEKLEWFLANVPEDDVKGRAFQLRDLAWVARPPRGE